MATPSLAGRPKRNLYDSRWFSFPVLAGGLGIALAILIIYPLVAMLPEVFVEDGSPNLSAFVEAWTAPGAVTTLKNTVIAVGVSTSLAVVIGASFAWLTERTDARMGRLSDLLPVAPMMVPPLAGTIGWIVLLTPGPGYLNALLRDILGAFGVTTGDEGPLNIFSWYGLMFVYVLYLVPHVYLTVGAALRNLDPSLEEASRANGAGPWRTFFHVTMPAVRPAIAGGALLALVISIALFSVPVLIGTPAGIEVLAVRVVRLTTFQFPPELDTAIVLGLVMILVIGSAWILQVRFLRAGRHATIGGRAAGTSRVSLGPWRWVARASMLAYLLATSVLPFLALVLISVQPFWSSTIRPGTFDLESYQEVLVDNPLTRSAFQNSILLGVGGATVAMALAAIIVFFVQRNAASRIGRIVDGATKLPGALSHVVVALALIAAFAGPPFGLSGTLLLLFLGYLILYIPQATVTAGSSLAQVDKALSEASLVCGAPQGRTFRKVALPLMLPGLTAGWVFVFVLMAGDVTASVMLASTNTPVIGFAMLGLFQAGTYPTVAALGAVISVITSAIVLGALSWTRRRDRRLPTSSA